MRINDIFTRDDFYRTRCQHVETTTLARVGDETDIALRVRRGRYFRSQVSPVAAAGTGPAVVDR